MKFRDLVLPSAMYRGTELLTTPSGGYDAAAAGLPPALASHARGEHVEGEGCMCMNTLLMCMSTHDAATI